mmetsp:Transcript_102268/g.293410  ORF Transcript_102268/g.293410 Transcript_102268/m.293410 type:complete len:221 (+) Transcript_102268:99-761(+)
MQLIMSASTGSAPSTLACSAYSARRAEEVPQLHLDPVAHLAPQQNTALATRSPFRYRAAKLQLDGHLGLEPDLQRLPGDLLTRSSCGEVVSFSFASLASLKHELQMELEEIDVKIDDDLLHMSGGLASALRARRRKSGDVVTAAEDMVRIAGVPSRGSAQVPLVRTPPSHPRVSSLATLGAGTNDTSASTQPEMMLAPPSQPRQGNCAPCPLPGSAVVHR